MQSAMDLSLIGIRVRKIVAAVSHRQCWTGIAIGVAPSAEHLSVLKTLSPDGIIDVGANRGQFTLACRIVFPHLPIVAFEPIPGEAVTYRRVHGKITRITLIETALGDAAGTAILHLSKSADSSSLLPIGKRQAELFQNTIEIGTLQVTVKRLDDFATNWDACSRLLLKIDVQGFELNVLRGAIQTLRSCAYVYVECSEVLLYDGQALRNEVVEFLNDAGFAQIGQYNCLTRNGILIQADYLFINSILK